MNGFTVFAALMVGHVVADYPLQGDFLSRAKNRTAPIPGVPWWQALGAHALIHGGMVALILWQFGVPQYAVLIVAAGEVATHAVVDDGKCRGLIGFNTDQAMHVVCKAAWAFCAWVILALHA